MSNTGTGVLVASVLAATVGCAASPVVPRERERPLLAVVRIEPLGLTEEGDQRLARLLTHYSDGSSKVLDVALVCEGGPVRPILPKTSWTALVVWTHGPAEPGLLVVGAPVVRATVDCVGVPGELTEAEARDAVIVEARPGSLAADPVEVTLHLPPLAGRELGASGEVALAPELTNGSVVSSERGAPPAEPPTVGDQVEQALRTIGRGAQLGAIGVVAVATAPLWIPVMFTLYLLISGNC